VVVFCVVLAYFSSAVRSGKVEGKFTKKWYFYRFSVLYHTLAQIGGNRVKFR
jgi:hypothetical protein